jgi:hypothetical protein
MLKYGWENEGIRLLSLRTMERAYDPRICHHAQQFAAFPTGIQRPAYLLTHPAAEQRMK